MADLEVFSMETGRTNEFNSRSLKFIKNNSRLSEKIKNKFENKIKLSIVTRYELVFITDDDRVFKICILPLTCVPITLREDDSLIEECIVEELCYKKIFNIVYGFGHVFAMTESGDVYCWGLNKNGQLGLGEKDDKDFGSVIIPKLNKYLSGKGFIDIKCGIFHTLALTQNGDVYAFGLNNEGQLGIGNTEEQVIPILLEAFDKIRIVAISCGGYHSVALTESGQVYCWGKNINGQLGVGKRPDFLKLPTLCETRYLKGIKIVAISCGEYHTIILSKDGEIFTFGSNIYGQIGNNFDNTLGWNVTHPVKLNSPEKFIDISSHFSKNISIALSKNEICYIWGDFNNEVIPTPKPTEFKSIEEVFAHRLEITNKVVEGICQFNDPFILSGKLNYYYEIDGELGNGSFGTVLKVKEKSSKKVFALKKIPIKDLKKENSLCLKEFEISSLIRSFNNQSIIKYYNSWFENNIENNEYNKSVSFYILMEMCDKTLENIITEIENDSNLCVDQTLTPIGYFIASELYIEILEGIMYLHKQTPPIIHRDIKPENILLKKMNDGKYIKIADFDLLAIHKFFDQKHTTDKGTPKYTAPEVMNGEEYDTKADIYSLGVVFQQFLNIDFEGAYDEIESSILKSKYVYATEFHNRMTNDHPFERPICEEIINDKKLWAVNRDDFDFEKQNGNIAINSDGNEVPYIYSVILAKLGIPVGREINPIPECSNIHETNQCEQSLNMVQAIENSQITHTIVEAIGSKMMVSLGNPSNEQSVNENEFTNFFKELLVKSKTLSQNELKEFFEENEENFGKESDDNLINKALFKGLKEQFCNQNSISKQVSLPALFKNFLQNRNEYDITFSSHGYIKQKSDYKIKFDKLSKIGEGTFGELFKIRVNENFSHYRESQIQAIKKVGIFYSEEMELYEMFKDLLNLIKIRNERIVECFDAWLENHYNLNELFLFVRTELCDGNLKELLKVFQHDQATKVTLSGYNIASYIFIEILEGVNYLHKQKPVIIHKYLKPENILFKKVDNYMLIKIADTCFRITEEFVLRMQIMAKDERYSAPEVLKAKKIDQKSDIFSLGVIIEELFDIDLNKEYSSVENEISLLTRKYKELNKLYIKMTKESPNDRPECEEILKIQHLWALYENEFEEKI